MDSELTFEGLTWPDYTVIVLYFVFVLAVGLYVSIRSLFIPSISNPSHFIPPLNEESAHPKSISSQIISSRANFIPSPLIPSQYKKDYTSQINIIPRYLILPHTKRISARWKLINVFAVKGGATVVHRIFPKMQF